MKKSGETTVERRINAKINQKKIFTKAHQQRHIPMSWKLMFQDQDHEKTISTKV